jgi:hypothetical protein
VSDPGDAGRPVDVGTYVPFPGYTRCARVDAHPHADRPAVQLPLRFGCCRQRLGRRREGHEEGVTLSIDLHPVMTGERFPQDAPVLGECVRVGPCPEPLEESRRALDVGEEKGDRPGRECLLHTPDDVAAADGLQAEITGARTGAHPLEERREPASARHTAPKLTSSRI